MPAIQHFAPAYEWVGVSRSVQKFPDNWDIVFVQNKYLEYVTDNNRSYSQAFFSLPFRATSPPHSLLPPFLYSVAFPRGKTLPPLDDDIEGMCLSRVEETRIIKFVFWHSVANPVISRSSRCNSGRMGEWVTELGRGR